MVKKYEEPLSRKIDFIKINPQNRSHFALDGGSIYSLIINHKVSLSEPLRKKNLISYWEAEFFFQLTFVSQLF